MFKHKCLLSSSCPGGVPGGEENTRGADPGGVQSSMPLNGSPFWHSYNIKPFSNAIYIYKVGLHPDTNRVMSMWGLDPTTLNVVLHVINPQHIYVKTSIKSQWSFIILNIFHPPHHIPRQSGMGSCPQCRWLLHATSHRPRHEHHGTRCEWSDN